MRTGREFHSREQVFLIAVVVFVAAYAIGFARSHSLEWTAVVSTGALAIAVVAGLIVTEIIARPASEPAEHQGEPDDGVVVDFARAAEAARRDQGGERAAAD